MMIRSHCPVMFLLASMAISLAGCASAPVKNRSIESRLIASSDVNPDRSGVASPITLRIVQLRSDSTFKSASLLALFGNAQATVGPDFVSVEEQVLRPGEQRPLLLSLRPETEFIGVVAGFQDVSTASWRDVKSVSAKSILPGKGDAQITISVGRSSVSIGN